jgi:hypothetical protein
MQAQGARQDSMLFRKVLGTLNEAQRRWLVGREALRGGRGGIQRMVETSGLSKPTILRGIRELRGKAKLVAEEGRVRKPGGGRKPVEEHDPKITRLLEQVMEESTVGDPMSPLKWNSKSTYQIQEYLARQGHPVSEDTIQRRLREMDYSLQANRKDKEGESHADRDRQFRYLNETAKRFLQANEPVISVDTKKKERVGNFKNSGRKWRKKGEAPKVNIHDFPSLAEGTAIPYGAYDVRRNEGMVNVGMTHDTAEFAVESIRRWWRRFGVRHYPEARRLFICADSGGSNAARNRAWKYYLAAIERRDRVGGCGGSLSARDEQMEQDRAPDVLLHQHELERRTAGQFPDRGQYDLRHQDEARTAHPGAAGPQCLRDWSEDQ